MKLLNNFAFYLFLILLLLCLTNTANAQSGCEMEIFLRTQADVDAFAIPGSGPAGVVPGSVVIGPEASNGTTDITNLDGLSSLVQVHGTLLIERNPLLTDISGLSNLTTIGGGSCAFQELVIQENPLIESLDGLQNLSGFVSRFMIRDAPLVTDLNDVSGVTGSDFLWLGGLTGITNVDALSNFTTLRGLYLTNNDELLNLDGLSGVSGPFTGGQDFISGNHKLQNLNGLAGVTKTNTLTVRNCDALVDMSGLGGVTEVTDILSINNNPGLTSLNGLNPNLEINGKLTVVGNTQLSNCAVEAVCNHLSMNGNTSIFANLAGCDNTNEVLDNCSPECADGITETLTTQAEVDAFATNYPGCRNFLGDIVIEEAPSLLASTAITDLSSLADLKEVGSLLIMNAPSVTDLSALNGLDTVRGNLFIRNTGVVNLDDMDELDYVGLRFSITFNPALTSVTGLTGVTEVGRSFDVRDNPMLTDLSGFANLELVGDEFIIAQNPSLPDLTDFTSLRFAYDGLLIEDNDLFTSLAGLESLENINGSMRIMGNAQLADITALENLDQQGVITATSGTPGSANLVIEDNPLLSNCSIITVCNFLAGPATVVAISGNAVGCESKPVIEADCNLLPIGLRSFSANQTGKIIRVDWSTETEDNVRDFSLERSHDEGRSFQTVTVTPATEQPNGADYGYDDNSAFSLRAARVYYRLRVTDMDGSEQIFGPVMVALSNEQATFQAFPNPVRASSMINIQGAAAGAKLELRAVDGRRISTLSPGANGQYQLPDIVPGVYVLSTMDEQRKQQVTRVVVR